MLLNALTLPRTRHALRDLLLHRRPVPAGPLNVILWWATSLLALALAALLRGYMDDLGFPVHSASIERALFGGLPSAWLQDHVFRLSPGAFSWAAVVVHASWFVVPWLAALLVSVRCPDRIGSYFRWWISLHFLVLIGFAVFPLQPPWMAESGITRIISLRLGSDINDPNPLAAMPSLHVALPLLISLWFFRERWVAPALAMLGYSTLVATEVVFSGEHYVVDVMGAAVAAATVALLATIDYEKVFSRLDLRRCLPSVARRVRPALETAPAKSERGQALLELAFVLPIVVLFILVFVDFGIALDRREVLQHAVREGTRQGVVAAQHPNCAASDTLCAIKNYTVDQSEGLLAVADVTACVVNTNNDAVNGNTGDDLRVQASFNYKFTVGSGEILTAFGLGVPTIAMTPSADLRLETTVSGISVCS